MRAYKTVNDAYIEPISFTVPRRAEGFQADIYPPAVGLRPAVSANEWLSGKDAIPAKIDLESVYEGNAPKEVPADYKPSVSAPAPAPTKTSAPTPKAEPESKPAVESRGPPPSMAEQKGSIAAMASKFQDDDDDDDDDEDDEESSFEEISKPVQKSVPAAAKAAAAPATANASSTNTAPPKAAPATQPAAVKATPPAAVQTAAPRTADSTSSNVESSLEQIKAMLEAQTRTITAQSEKIGMLAREVDSLKMQVGSGGATNDQSERIRQLELELEAARS